MLFTCPTFPLVFFSPCFFGLLFPSVGLDVVICVLFSWRSVSLGTFTCLTSQGLRGRGVPWPVVCLRGFGTGDARPHALRRWGCAVALVSVWSWVSPGSFLLLTSSFSLCLHLVWALHLGAHAPAGGPVSTWDHFPAVGLPFKEGEDWRWADGRALQESVRLGKGLWVTFAGAQGSQNTKPFYSTLTVLEASMGRECPYTSTPTPDFMCIEITLRKGCMSQQPPFCPLHPRSLPTA